MAAVTCNDLRRELNSFAETTLQSSMDDLRKQLFQQLKEWTQNEFSYGAPYSSHASFFASQHSLPGSVSFAYPKGRQMGSGRRLSAALPNSEGSGEIKLSSRGSARFLGMDQKAAYGEETEESKKKKRSMIRATRKTKMGRARESTITANVTTMATNPTKSEQPFSMVKSLSVQSSKNSTVKAFLSDTAYDVDLDDPDEIQALLEDGGPLLDGDEEAPRTMLGEMVRSPVFESIVGVTVVLNAIFIGIETDLQAQGEGKVESVRRLTGPIFCLCFSLELVMRLSAEGCAFFRGERWGWNLFDFVMVLMQIMDEVQHYLVSKFDLDRASFLRMFRLVRLIRITRLLRVIHLFEDLRTIAGSMVQSIGALLWALVILVMVIYMFSVLVMQAITTTEAAGEVKHRKELDYWFGSLSRTMLTMFECILGGVSWDEVIMPLITDVGPIMGLTFCAYLALSLYAITNMLTGIFVERATAQAREDKDTFLANRMRDIFFLDKARSHPHFVEEVTWDQFEEKLEHDTMHEFFQTINVDLTEAKSIFHLLDHDGGGCLDAKELVNGCLRLRGPARALELAMLMSQCDKLQETLEILIAMQNGIRLSELPS